MQPEVETTPYLLLTVISINFFPELVKKGKNKMTAKFLDLQYGSEGQLARLISWPGRSLDRYIMLLYELCSTPYLNRREMLFVRENNYNCLVAVHCMIVFQN